MVLSFLPVFALGGIEGKMFRPLAYTKTFALVPSPCWRSRSCRRSARSSSAAACGRRAGKPADPERDRGLPARPLVPARPPGRARLGAGRDVPPGFAPLGQPAGPAGDPVRRRWSRRRLLGAGGGRPCSPRSSLLLVALVADQTMPPLGREFMTPLDEGMVMDMPITVPRASVTRIGRRSEGARHGPLPVPRGRHGRGQGGPGRDADRPGADGHDRDHGQLPPARTLAAPQAPGRRRRAARPRAVSMRWSRAASIRARRRRRPRSAGRARRSTAASRSSMPPAVNMPTTATRNSCASTGGISPTSTIPHDPPSRLRALWREHVAQARRRAGRPGGADLHPACARAASRPRDHHRPGRGGHREALREVRDGVASGHAAPSADGPRPSPRRGRRRPRARASSRSPRSTRSRPSCRRRSPAALALEGRPRRAGRRSAASSTWPSRCRAGPTSGRCRSRTGSTCSPPA